MASLLPIKKKSISEKIMLIDKIAEKVNKKHGKCIIGRIGATPEIAERLKIKFVPTACPDLNVAVGGGFAKKRCTIITGNEDSGKTSLVLESAGKAMAEDPDFVLLWLESENSLDKDYMCNTFKIDPDRLVFLPIDSGISAEDALDLVHATLQTGSIDMVCVNSLAALVPTQEMEADLSAAVVGTQARLNSRMVRKFTAIVAEYETAFVIITRLTTMIGSMSRDPLELAGGRAIKHWSALTLDMRKHSIAPGDPITKEEGLKIGVTVKKNHVCPTKFPYVKMEYFVVFGEGVEVILTALNQAINKEIIVSKGAWLKQYDPATGEEVNKWNGKAAFRQYMKENPKEFEKLAELVYGGIALSDEEVAAIKAEEEENLKAIDPDLLAEISGDTEEKVAG